MSLFRRRSTDQKKVKEEQGLEQQKQKQKELEERVYAALRDVLLFPGSKSEFEEVIGYSTEWVNLGRNNLGLVYDAMLPINVALSVAIAAEIHRDRVIPNPIRPFGHYTFDFQKRIVDLGVVALVNVNFSNTNPTFTAEERYFYYGMPVKRK